MITAEIKIHKEPTPYMHVSYHSYTLMSATAKEDFDKKHQAALEEAKKTVKVDQTVKLDVNVNRVRITGFIEDPTEVIWYSGNMCVVFAQHLNSTGTNSLRYSIAEFDLTTLKDPEQKQLTLQGANDGLPC